MATDWDNNNNNRPANGGGAAAANPNEGGFSLADLLENLIYYKWHFLIVSGLVFLLSVAYAIMATPIYTADVLIQIEEKKGSNLGALNAVAKALDVQQSPVAGEIEVIRSRNVMGRAVEAQQAHTDIWVGNRFPLVGRFLSTRLQRDETTGLVPSLFGLDRFAWGGEEIRISDFDVPDHLLAKRVTLDIVDASRWKLLDEEGALLLEGTAGEAAHAQQGQLNLSITGFRARPGTRFQLVRYSTPSQISRMLPNLTAAETKRQSGMLRMTYTHADPVKAAKLVNAVADAYVEQNLERRSEEADKSLKFLKEQLPQLKGGLEAAERRLNAFRNQEKSIDITGEIRLLLEKSTSLEKSKLELELKRRELLQRYEPQHPAIKAIDSQLVNLKSEAGTSTREISGLPRVQQEYIRLTRDVEVNNQLYVGLLNNAQQLEVARAGTTGNVAIIDRAVVPEKATKPNKPVTVAVGGLLALVLGFLVAQVVGFMAQMVRDPKKLEAAVGVPTLGILPLAVEQDQSKATKDNPYMLAHAAPTAAPVEALRSLRTAVLFALSETTRSKVVLITSAVPGQGKSFIAANLAYLFASGGKRVLLIDADVRRSTIGRYVKEPKPVVGLSAVLQDGKDADALILRNVYAQLDVLPAGQHVKNPGDLFSRSTLPDLVKRFSEQYDLVLIDSPPVLPVNDAASMAGMADVTLFVARQDLVTQAEVEESLVLLQRAGKKVTGLVFNGFIPSRLRYGYGYKYSYYRYGYKYKKYGGYKYENPYQ